jgi:tRNA threonylcarbamoyladenosine biosynthesis protein TsaB
MNVLAFDTCLGAVSAAVRRRGPDGGWLLHEACEVRSAGHAERLFPLIAEVMGAAGLAFADLDRIAVTAGPGTFTGVRVGVSAARALALAAGKPVVAATSLAVMALGAGERLGGAIPQGRRLVVAVDARRGALYVQGFAARAADAGEARMLTGQEAAAWIGRKPALLVGSAAPALAALVNQAGGDAEHRFPDLQPHARNLAVLAASLAPVSPVKPLYLRPPDVRPQEGAALARAQA